eukprot:CAMPEP_0115847704 /NCGR_PEP_ID=MMETSP0287-20121206/10523_1 /TAXON_ID=412157 /ORGANISM="Chrysochromulina rotalis, Strain UIO044" /LENGTH=71 /DNA_ID=CAMNT_0003301553 /DNA_START=25 /DNA_END=240 /DNA_ORIENTATION=+
MLRVFLLAVLAVMASAFQSIPVAQPSRAAIDTRFVQAVGMSSGFFDAGLDNEAIPEDKDAQPARKCASCFG